QVPEYCQILGGVETVILFEIAMPTTSWNGRFFFMGGGGYNGNIPDLTPALARGYAVTATDTGHRGEHWDASALYNDARAQLNYAHRGAHLVTEIAKQVVAAYYEQGASKSYFLGCSNGGKMGLMAVQRYPEDFDGVVIGGPVIDRTGLMVMFDWSQRALLDAEIPPYKVPAMERATLAACDADDGLADGVIGRPDVCDFDPGVLLCADGDTAQCLTAQQVDAWRKILDGPSNSAGVPLYAGYLPGHEDDYPAYVTGLGVMHGYPSSNFMYMDNFMRWFVFGPAYDAVRQFDFDHGPAALARFVTDQDATDPDLRDFEARGGKLLIYNGWADHSTPPERAIEYYEAVRGVHGEDVDDFARLFMVPGFHHCSGGPGPNVFGSGGRPFVNLNDPERDLMGAIVNWVENGVAPDSLIATKYTDDQVARGIERTRPLCPYPQIAQYLGSGSIDDAGSFACAAPSN
ncbi:MAG TPA: tannase/feruloyl esterase family alpha/beta hydrolase, partial [Gammaproteobacteria bacterium]|nr:tannase/feruloyl esterase family alpha/beta hydrolase [Gammaproteobacteria bacterium]